MQVHTYASLNVDVLSGIQVSLQLPPTLPQVLQECLSWLRQTAQEKVGCPHRTTWSNGAGFWKITSCSLTCC